MDAYQPKDIATIVGGEVRGGSHGTVTGVSIDSRRTKPGDLFVAIATPANDGHRFVPAAFASGATAALVSDVQARAHLRDWDIHTIIPVDGTVEAMQAWSHAHRRRYGYPIIAVTGSNGKTTTKEFIASTLGSMGPILKTEGTLNNHLGVPMTLLEMTEAHKAAVVEMGMNHAGEIALLGRLAEASIGVITNTGQAHLEFFGTLGDLIDAKWELAGTLTGDRLMVLNRDDAGLRARAETYDGPIAWFGIENKCEWTPDSLERDDDGRWTFAVRGVTVRMRVPGRHMIENALAALAVADAVGVPLSDAAEALGRTESAERRMRSLVIEGLLVLDDAYNANPSSMKAALDTLTTLEGRHVAVLGGMHELGEQGAALHREVGRYAADLGVDVIAVGELGRHIAAGAFDSGGVTVMECETHAKATDWLAANVRSGDVVLVKGSRGERMETVIDGLQLKMGSNSEGAAQ